MPASKTTAANKRTRVEGKSRQIKGFVRVYYNKGYSWAAFRHRFPLQHLDPEQRAALTLPVTHGLTLARSGSTCLLTPPMVNE